MSAESTIGVSVANKNDLCLPKTSFKSPYLRKDKLCYLQDNLPKLNILYEIRGDIGKQNAWHLNFTFRLTNSCQNFFIRNLLQMSSIT